MSRRSERCRHQPLLEADAHKPVEEIQASHPTLHGPAPEEPLDKRDPFWILYRPRSTTRHRR
jgi:hypothetical protein